MKYERLTTKCEVGIGLTETSGNIVNDYEKVVNRLAELEDKIERGELVDALIKVGIEIDDAVKEITKRIFYELYDYFVEQSAYAVDYNQHTGYYDYEIKVSDVVCDIVAIAEKYGVELGAKDDD